jgi:Type I phosphodiesterase / nucleotide pyrophosphatase
VIQRRLLSLFAAACVLLATVAQAEPHSKIKHLLLISVDGMHALDFANCRQGIATVNGGEPYCPNLARLAEHAVDYAAASTSKPSDSFPGLTALITGGTPRSTGTYYDVSYDRSLSLPLKTTSAGIVADPCPSVIGTQVGFDESIDVDSSRLDGGGGIDPNFLPRDPKHGCAPVYLTIFCG